MAVRKGGVGVEKGRFLRKNPAVAGSSKGANVRNFLSMAMLPICSAKMRSCTGIKVSQLVECKKTHRLAKFFSVGLQVGGEFQLFFQLPDKLVYLVGAFVVELLLIRRELF
jgi:hypothetical protein